MSSQTFNPPYTLYNKYYTISLYIIHTFPVITSGKADYTYIITVYMITQCVFIWKTRIPIFLFHISNYKIKRKQIEMFTHHNLIRIYATTDPTITDTHS